MAESDKQKKPVPSGLRLPPRETTQFPPISVGATPKPTSSAYSSFTPCLHRNFRKSNKDSERSEPCGDSMGKRSLTENKFDSKSVWSLCSAATFERPGFSFPKSEKLRFLPSDVPGVGTYNAYKKLDFINVPGFSSSKSAREDKYWENKLYARSPGPVYSYVSEYDTASPTGRSKGTYMKPGKLDRMIHNSSSLSEGPSPEHYVIHSDFDKLAKKIKFNPVVNREKKRLESLPTYVRLHSKVTPGPGSYTPQQSILSKNIKFSFSKDGKLWARFKDNCPKVSPVSYRTSHYGKQSTRKASPKFSFGSAQRVADFSKWVSGYK